MKSKKEFDIKKTILPHTMVIAKLLDPYTAKLSRIMYNLGFTANLVTAIGFVLGVSSISTMLIFRNFWGLLAAAVLITLKNITDTVDGKIARGSDTLSPIGGFFDIISDWIFFHAAIFITIGYLTDHIVIGFLCVTGYMSREFARRKFIYFYGEKATETNEAKKMSWIVFLVRRYDLGSSIWLTPVILLISPVFLIYATVIIEYTLLIGELGFDFLCLLRQSREKKSNIERKINRI
jgi:phosphatidylglycerophosphate synthase